MPWTPQGVHRTSRPFELNTFRMAAKMPIRPLEIPVQRIRSLRTCSQARLTDLYVRRAELDHAISALERIQSMQARRNGAMDWDSLLGALRLLRKPERRQRIGR